MQRRVTRLSGFSCCRMMAVLFLLVLSPFMTLAQAQAQTNSSSTQYADHGFSALATSDRVTLALLDSVTGGSTSVSAYEQVIEDAYLSLGVHEVLLDIGWQNFTAGDPQYEAWVSNWFTASDVMGLSNVVYVGQLTSQGFDSPWVDSLISADPSAATYYANGTRADFVSLDNPAVAQYLETDLGMLYSYYGNYSSWVGLGTGSSQSNPYYATSESMPVIGYSNVTISNFASSSYYSSDVNSTGYLPDGELDILWSEYRDVQPGIVLSSGLWMTSSPYEVYGSGSNSSFVEMRFEVPSNTSNLQVEWYGNEVGAPEGLEVAAFGDKSGSLNTGDVIARTNATASDFTNTTGWQQGVHLSGNFTAGWYWVEFSSPSSNQSDYYRFFMKDYLINNATALAQQAAVGPGFQQGSTILWVKNQAGDNLAIYPYQEAFIGAPEQEFTATHVFSFNTVFLFLSDRSYNTANATLTLTDVTGGDKVVATGLLSQALDQGLENWVPIALNGTVTTVMGDEYVLTVNDPSVSWIPIMRYIVTSPAQAGFQGQNQTLLFELGDVDWSQGLKGLGGITDLADSPTNGTMDAIRFSPDVNETMKSVQILMYTTQGTGPSNYTSGTLSVTIWASNDAGSAPGYPLQQLNVPATKIPEAGFLNVSGFSLPVTGGKYYWIVFSADSNQTFTFARLTSPFEYLVQVSANGGVSWYNPSDGPTELAFTVRLSDQTLGTYIAGETVTPLSQTTIFAQPFVASSDSAVEGVYIGPLSPGPDLLVSIVPTQTDGKPAPSSLASGVYDADNITLDYGPEFVQFSSIADLQQGEEYWITIQPIGGSYGVAALLYLDSDPDLPINSSALVSADAGSTWTSIGSSTTVATLPEYLVETATVTPPQYSTQEIVSDLAANDNFSVSTGPLKGWNAYIQAGELETFNSVSRWLSDLAGRDFQFFTNAQPNVLDQLNLKGITNLPAPNSTSSCGELLNSEESAIATDGTQFTYASLSMLRQCTSQGVQSLSQELNYLPDFGTHFGLGTGANVLVVGDQPGSNLTGFLSNAFNVTYVNFPSDPTLQLPENTSSFKAILWIAPDNETVSPAVSGLLHRYVDAGGELITSDTSLAVATGSASAPSAVSSQPGSFNATSFLDTALLHTTYAGDSFQESVTSTGLSARSAGLNITASVVGAGKTVSVSFGSASPPQAGEQYVVISNLVADAANVPPPLWYQAGISSSSADEFSVEGAHDGRLLLLVYNPSDATSDFVLSLNGTYYGIPSDWKTVGIPSLNVTAGVGTDVQLETTVPAQGLVGILVVPAADPLVSYSTGTLEAEYTYPDQSLYSIAANHNQSVLVMISTNDTASQLVLDDLTTLSQMASIGQLNNSTTGWYFNAKTDSLFIKYQSTGSDTLRYVFYAPAPPPPKTIPLGTLVTVLVAAVVVEIVAGIVLTLRRQSRKQSDLTDTSRAPIPEGESA